jgi:subtilisin family serine protease
LGAAAAIAITLLTLPVLLPVSPQGGPAAGWDGLEKAGVALRTLVERGELGESTRLWVYPRPSEDLVTSSSTLFVPDGVDPRIMRFISPADMEVIRDYWVRYADIPGEPSLPASRHEEAFARALQSIQAHNHAVVAAQLEELAQRLGPAIGWDSLGYPPGPHDEALLVYAGEAQVRRILQDAQVEHVSAGETLEDLIETTAKSINADHFWTSGYVGNGQKVGIVDSGINPTSELVVGGEQKAFDPADQSTGESTGCNHGTSVASVVRIRRSPYYRGVAADDPVAGSNLGAMLYNAKVTRVDPMNGCISDPDTSITAMDWLASKGVQIVVHSRGSQVEDDGSSDASKKMDYKAATLNLLVAQAAGNWGTAKKVITPAGAYNLLTVGGTDDKDSETRSGDTIWSDSATSGSARWTKDLRNKPDVMAPAKDVHVLINDGDLRLGTGTSFAAPHAAGMAALIKSKFGVASALELKARLIHGEKARVSGWDSTWAWAYLKGSDIYATNMVFAGSVASGGTTSFSVTIPRVSSRYFTLVWNREMSGPTTIKGFSNLDLSVVCPNTGTTSSSSVIQNVERVQASSFQVGQTCSLKVKGTSVPFAGTQPFVVVGSPI